MRFMVLVKANEDSEAGVLPDEKILTAMGKFNQQLEKAGVLLAGEGLQASSKGARVKFSGGKRTVTDGPFTETKELVAGYWVRQVKSKEEAMEGARRSPCGAAGELEGLAHQVLRRGAHSDRRALRRGEGADRGLHAHPGEVQGRGDGVGATLPQPCPGR